MMTFAEYVAMREGLWLNDKNAVVGLSKIAPPKPPKKTKPTPTPKIKPFHVAKTEGSLDQLQRSVGELDRLGIGLLPPKRDDLKRLVDKHKNQVTVPVVAPPSPQGQPCRPSPPGQGAGHGTCPDPAPRNMGCISGRCPTTTTPHRPR